MDLTLNTVYNKFKGISVSPNNIKYEECLPLKCIIFICALF